MLLKNEVIPGEIYVYDSDIRFMIGKQNPSLWQLVQVSETKKSRGMFGEFETNETNPIWENIETGELVNYATHCFTTIERIKKQKENLFKISDEKRREFILNVCNLISKYESQEVK